MAFEPTPEEREAARRKVRAAAASARGWGLSREEILAVVEAGMAETEALPDFAEPAPATAAL